MHVRSRKSALTFVVAMMVLAACPAKAQQLPDAPAPAVFAMASESTVMPEMSAAVTVSPRQRPAVHRFFDRTSMLSSGVLAAALLTDGAITQATLGQTKTEYHSVNGMRVPYQVRIVEADPIGKLFVNHGWAGTIAGGGVTLGADLGVRYWLHKTNHHRLERIVPFAIAASNAWAAWHDTRY